MLANEDQTLNDAFERIEVEQIGAGTHERLHRMIMGLAPRIDAYTVWPAHEAPGYRKSTA